MGVFFMKRLYKSRYDSKLDGVCGGVAKYFGIDSTLVRLILIIGAFTIIGLPVVVIAYILCAVIMPREPEILD